MEVDFTKCDICNPMDLCENGGIDDALSGILSTWMSGYGFFCKTV